MGTAEKKLYKDYQKVLKELDVRQFTDEEYLKAIRRFKRK